MSKNIVMDLMVLAGTPMEMPRMPSTCSGFMVGLQFTREFPEAAIAVFDSEFKKISEANGIPYDTAILAARWREYLMENPIEVTS